MTRKIHEVQVGTDQNGKEYKFINLEPHYCRVFDKAVDQVKKYLPVREGRALVVEMLEFGQRLNAHYHCKDCNNDNTD